jgi:acyl-CoA thioesterase FadM
VAESRADSEVGATRASLPYRVRFDEANPDGLVRTSTLLRWAQDVAWVHSERMGFTRAWYLERGLAWLVRGVELAVLAPIPPGRELAVGTEVVGYRKVWARRRTEFRTSSGELAAWAHTDWVITDRRGAPVRVPSDFGAFVAHPAPSFDPTRVGAGDPADGAPRRILPVRLRELDPMGHVNNAIYLDHLEEGVAGVETGLRAVASIPRTYRLEYLVPAAPGDELVAVAWRRDPARFQFRLARPDDVELFRGVLETAAERGAMAM